MQFQADLLDVPVVRPKVLETTALGAAYLAGLTVDLWKSRDELASHWKAERRFEPRMRPCRKGSEDVALARGRCPLARVGKTRNRRAYGVACTSTTMRRFGARHSISARRSVSSLQDFTGSVWP